ncbi:MAG TPA: hypothetical protein PLT55_00110 [Acidimicrobiia bacterium]|nr:hypothetical protein [Acidimicrobiia bacterium]
MRFNRATILVLCISIVLVFHQYTVLRFTIDVSSAPEFKRFVYLGLIGIPLTLAVLYILLYKPKWFTPFGITYIAYSLFSLIFFLDLTSNVADSYRNYPNLPLYEQILTGKYNYIVIGVVLGVIGFTVFNLLTYKTLSQSGEKKPFPTYMKFVIPIGLLILICGGFISTMIYPFYVPGFESNREKAGQLLDDMINNVAPGNDVETYNLDYTCNINKIDRLTSADSEGSGKYFEVDKLVTMEPNEDPEEYLQDFVEEIKQAGFKKISQEYVSREYVGGYDAYVGENKGRSLEIAVGIPSIPDGKAVHLSVIATKCFTS